MQKWVLIGVVGGIAIAAVIIGYYLGVAVVEASPCNNPLYCKRSPGGMQICQDLLNWGSV